MNNNFKEEFEKHRLEMQQRSIEREKEYKRENRNAMLIVGIVLLIWVVVLVTIGFLLIRYAPELYEALLNYLNNN